MKRRAAHKPEVIDDWTHRRLAIVAGPNGAITRLEATIAGTALDLHGSGRSITWGDWCARHMPEAEKYETFLACEMDTDPGALANSLAAANAWLAYAQARAGESEAFEERIKNRLTIVARNELGTLGEAFARDACSSVKAQKNRWRSLSDSLREYVWTARLVLKMQPVEPGAQVAQRKKS